MPNSPDTKLHPVMESDPTHNRGKVRGWLAVSPRSHVHHTPTSGWWLNLNEVWSGIVQRRAIK